MFIVEPPHDKSNKVARAPSEDSDQHPRSPTAPLLFTAYTV